ncbi:formimidoylglutamase [Oceanospirillum linum]|uniref:formimidoylglutamase n=1 Tax=Oceanospirillum linum TaxID=966 RepID=UPI00089E1C53|nr:formimidoylglutamase [Oceanospirillum linum]SEF42213.1 formiminoglutamase [Oleiphilus messinensis]SMP00967.1 formiminoglutamase [Oceanospirillum linum]
MTYKKTDMTLWKRKRLKDQATFDIDQFWSGRIKALEDYSSECSRQSGELAPMALIGFATDEGVKRSAGRSGAAHGPLVIRRALANLAWHQKRDIYDAGDIWCEEEQLIIAQSQLAGHVAHLLDIGLTPVILGGGLEVGWASYQGASRHVFAGSSDVSVGIVSLGARLAMSEADPQPNAQSVFLQIAQYCKERNLDFPCYCLGLDEQVTSAGEFDRAEAYGVHWRLQQKCGEAFFPEIEQEIRSFLSSLDYLYLSVSLDLFSIAAAPGVSAPSVFGLDARVGMGLLRLILHEAQRAEVPLLLVDIAECNPLEDPDGRTARLAAGLVYEIAKV